MFKKTVIHVTLYKSFELLVKDIQETFRILQAIAVALGCPQMWKSSLYCWRHRTQGPEPGAMQASAWGRKATVPPSYDFYELQKGQHGTIALRMQ